jgi:hypothetical protein
MLLISSSVIKTFRDTSAYLIYNNHRLMSLTLKDPSTLPLLNFSHCDHVGYDDFYFKFQLRSIGSNH